MGLLPRVTAVTMVQADASIGPSPSKICHFWGNLKGFVIKLMLTRLAVQNTPLWWLLADLRHEQAHLFLSAPTWRLAGGCSGLQFLEV